MSDNFVLIINQFGNIGKCRKEDLEYYLKLGAKLVEEEKKVEEEPKEETPTTPPPLIKQNFFKKKK